MTLALKVSVISLSGIRVALAKGCDTRGRIMIYFRGSNCLRETRKRGLTKEEKKNRLLLGDSELEISCLPVINLNLFSLYSTEICGWVGGSGYKSDVFGYRFIVWLSFELISFFDGEEKAGGERMFCLFFKVPLFDYSAEIFVNLKGSLFD